MRVFNFRKASVNSRAELDARLAALQEDVMRFLENGGVSRLAAENRWRMEAAALVRESVIDVFSMRDPTPIFTERREGRLGDTVEFEQLINTLRVVEYAPQSHPQVFTPRKGKYTIRTAMYELAFGIPLQKILTRQHTIGEFVQMAGEAVTRHYVQLTLTAINTACAQGTTDIRGRPLRTMAAAADVSKEEIDEALRRMYQYNTGVTIYGSRYALDPIFDAGAEMSEDAAEELRQRGVIGTYRGARLVALEDDYNMYYQSFTNIAGIDWEKLIFIASGQPGAILLERDLSALEWEELDVKKAQWSTGVRFDHGILVHSPWRYHVIELGDGAAGGN